MEGHHRLLPTSAGWHIAWWVLFAVWVTDAILVMAHVPAGFLTSHAADLTLPPWLYIAFRRQSHGVAAWPVVRDIVASPFLTGGLLFIASCATEVSQYFWPRGLFPGTFDWYDLLSYAVGMGVVVAAELRWNIRAQGSRRRKGER